MWVRTARDVGHDMSGGLSTRGAAGLLALVVFAWGTNWPVTKLIVHDVTPLWSTAIRCMIAAAGLAPLLWAQGDFIIPKHGDMPVVLCTSILHMVAFFGTDRGRAAIRAGGQGHRARLYDAALGRDRGFDLPVGGDHGHVVALDQLAMAPAASGGRAHRRKERIPPGSASLAAAEALRINISHINQTLATPNAPTTVIDLSTYERAARGRNTLP